MKNEFARLKLNLLLRIILSVVAAYFCSAFILVFLVDGILQDPIARFLDNLGIYWALRTYKTELAILILVVMALIGIYIALSKLTSYLNIVSKAVDQIFDKEVQMIDLPDELSAIEKKLNRIKYDRQQKEQEAKESNQQKNDLIVYLAHDLKTPMTSIIGYLNLMTSEDQIPPAALKKYTGIVYDKAQRMELLLDELFEITKFNAQSMELVRRNVDVNLMIDQLVDEFYPTLLEKNLTCRVEKCGDLIMVIDGDQMARVFDNLLRNAVSYSEAGSEVQIKIQRTRDDEEGEVHISFSNYGVTIPPDKLDRIFEKFYRADEARSSGTGGAGLGLAIAKRIVDMHGGSLKARSSELWTTFTVTL